MQDGALLSELAINSAGTETLGRRVRSPMNDIAFHGRREKYHPRD
jgi:hypothetical protein